MTATSQSNAAKFVDRNKDIEAAGKCFTLGDSTKQCLEYPNRPQTPEKIHKFRCTTHAGPGRERIFYGRYSDPQVSALLTHGLETKPSYIAGDLVNPQPKSHFQYRLKEKKENSVYASRQRAPLGASHDQTPGLPEGVGPYDSTYGLPVLKDVSAGELVNPPKTRTQVNSESEEGLELYKKSHSAYTVGESYNRKYDWSRIPQTSMFGIETPHDNSGINTQKTLKWLTQTQSAKAAHITTKRNDDFRERTIPQVGLVHDPIKDTLKATVTDDHTFGIMVKPDEYGAGDLIHMRDEENYLRGKERARGVLASVRQHLKKANYHNFRDLKAAFGYYDTDSSGTIDRNELRKVCVQFNLPVQGDLIDSLLEYCDTDSDGRIDYSEFSNFLNWKDKMQSGLDEKGGSSDDYEKKMVEFAKEGMDKDGSAKVLKKQVDTGNQEYITSSSMINSTVDKAKILEGHRSYGIPTIRSDLPAPRIRRVGDSTNYGDESDSFGLLNPSLYSNKGVYEQDFFRPRSQQTIHRIFDSIGVEINPETFQQLWEKAKEQQQNGEVSVETFRGLLDEHAAEEFQRKMAVNGQSNATNPPSWLKNVQQQALQT